MGLREKIAAKSQRRYQTVTEPDGTQWTVRSLTNAEKDAQDIAAIDPETGELDMALVPMARRRMIAVSLVDSDTKEPLGESETELVGSLDAATAEIIYEACLELNTFSESKKKTMRGESS